MRECHVRFCERLGVRLPGATLPLETQKLASLPAVCGFVEVYPMYTQFGEFILFA